MTAYCYFDTSPLLRWAEGCASYEGLSEAEKTFSSSISEEVEIIINTKGNINAVSEITLIEFHNQLCVWERTGTMPFYDANFVDETWSKLMQWIVEGRLIVLNQPPKLVERALTYVKYATREKGRGLKAWDATHLFQAYYWARTLHTTVFFITADEGFKRILDDYPEFSKYVIIFDPLLKLSPFQIL